ncbi:STAS domain-containing protein [Cellulophaga baltica]|uniref:STAS domain-containing protein n=1 Tax=Cellulophaga TaxID=104264 RepID=UPI001C06CF2A|nr:MULTISPECIES: STAS domain-containing protein [Cellulophaga]MBU2996688.1 STAS domain-containing protein [Cellulophaga baltica]MDO6768082.1 STAS domain-containing protein [Cellulophaga sp. 1_MG-2023]
MPIEINEENGIHSLKGELNWRNANLIRNHVKNLLQANNTVIINIQKLNSMDKVAAKNLERLYKEATLENKKITFLEHNNEVIKAFMQKTKTHYIIENNCVLENK